MDEYSVIEATMSILLRGGWVLLPLFLIGWLGWFLMFERYGYYFMLKCSLLTHRVQILEELRGRSAFEHKIIAVAFKHQEPAQPPN